MNDEIKALRLFLNLSQDEFSKLLGVAVDTVRAWEQERSKPSRKAMRKIGALVKKTRAQQERN